MRRTIVNHAIDGLEAEVTFTSDCQERTIALADPDYDSDSADAAIEGWQERAREELSAMATKEAA